MLVCGKRRRDPSPARLEVRLYERLHDVSEHFVSCFLSPSREKWAIRKIKKLFLGVVVARLGRRAAASGLSQPLFAVAVRTWKVPLSSSLPPFCGSYIITMRATSLRRMKFYLIN